MKSVKFFQFAQNINKFNHFHTSCIINAEPIKKKKVDTNFNLLRAQRKAKKIEKELKRLDKKGRILKPIIEIEGNYEVIKTMEERQRITEPPSAEEQLNFKSLKKEWARYLFRQNSIEEKNYRIIMKNQVDALKELRLCSEELYQDAIQPDWNSFPFTSKELVSEVLEDYDPPDGDYKNTTLTYTYDVEIDKKLMYNKPK